MPDNLAQRIADMLTRRDIQLLRLAAGDEVVLAQAISELTDDLIYRLVKRDPTAVGKKAGGDRLNAAIDEAKGIITSKYREMYSTERKQLLDVMRDEAAVIPQSVSSGLGVSQAAANRLVSETIEAATRRDIIDNRVITANATDAETMRGFFEREAASYHKRYTGTLKQAFSRDETLSQMVERLREVTQIQARGMDALIRTSYNHAISQLRAEMMGRNSHLFRGVIAIVKLDGNTTLLCGGRSRAMWNIFTGKPLPESPIQIPYPGPPNWHWNCRSQLYPLTHNAETIGELGGREVQEAIDALTPDQKKLLSVDPPDDETYTQWLKRQSSGVQNEVLGPARRKLWLEGKLNLADMVTQKGRPLTLKQLNRKVERAA